MMMEDATKQTAPVADAADVALVEQALETQTQKVKIAALSGLNETLLPFPEVYLTPEEARTLREAVTDYLTVLLRVPGHDEGTDLVLVSLEGRLDGLLTTPERLARTPIMLSLAEVSILREALLGFSLLLAARQQTGWTGRSEAAMRLYGRLGEFWTWWLN
jgi:hypothetical protein